MALACGCGNAMDLPHVDHPTQRTTALRPIAWWYVFRRGGLGRRERRRTGQLGGPGVRWGLLPGVVGLPARETTTKENLLEDLTLFAGGAASFRGTEMVVYLE